MQPSYSANTVRCAESRNHVHYYFWHEIGVCANLLTRKRKKRMIATTGLVAS